MKLHPLAIVLALCACRSTPSRQVESPLLEVDRAFARDTAAHRIEGWLDAFDVNGSTVDDSMRPVTGRDAVRAHWQGFFADPANELWWEPDTATISEAGNMGATSGRFSVLHKREDGSREVLSTGRYFDVWRRLPDGRWKLLYDIGDEDPAPRSKELR